MNWKLLNVLQNKEKEKEYRLETKETSTFTKWKERDNEDKKGKIIVKKICQK